MSELYDLYQQVILDHYRAPRNHAALDAADGRADGHNPLCGDRVTVYLQLDGEVVRDIGFEGAGCAISTAAASLMTEAVKGRPVAEVEALFSRFHALVTGDRDAAAPDGPELGKLEALGGVRDFPVRVKCATLAWHTLQAALAKARGVDAETAVTTE